MEREYLAALLDEIRAHEWGWVPETVYLGGGTPSRVDADNLARILAAVPGHPWCEATIEAAPGGITNELALRWARSGINRVSLGVQSFVQRELTRTGRKHTAEVVEREIRILREAGISNINVDLIAGLPGQTQSSWLESLAWVARLQAPHVSVYMLEIDEDSRLGSEVLLNGKRYGAPEIPSDETIAGFYETAVVELARMGIVRYEISNFARPGFESLHNLKYWRREPYAGFGADAHSFDRAIRSQNVETASEYRDRIATGMSARASSVAANSVEEQFFVGLRLSEGIRLASGDRSRFDQPIRRFVAEGLLIEEGDHLRLSDRGVLLSNEVLTEFIGS